MIAFSTSGKSREVLEILELARHLGVATIIGVTSHPDSELRELSDLVLDMGIIEEPCPLGLTPSASMAVMLAISDAIALSLLGSGIRLPTTLFLGWFGPRGLASILFVLLILEEADQRGPEAVPAVLRELAESAQALARAE